LKFIIHFFLVYNVYLICPWKFGWNGMALEEMVPSMVRAGEITRCKMHRAYVMVVRRLKIWCSTYGTQPLLPFNLVFGESESII
jgi:hypothetical protein